MFLFFIFLIIGVWWVRYLLGKRSNSVGCLIGKTAIVTGGNSGIGFATSVLLASRGCRVIIADIVNAEESRNTIKKLTGNQNILTKYLDLSSLKSVRKFADDIKTNEQKIDILINNAGIGINENLTTSDGLNSIMQINYFGAFLLTHLLLEPLKVTGSARIIFLGSVLAFFHNLSADNLNGLDSEITVFKMTCRYCNSKLCNILAAQEFGVKLAKHGIMVNSADPGFIRTGIFHSRFKPWWLRAYDQLTMLLLARGTFIGAQTSFHLASSEEMSGKTGGHYFLCKPWIKPSILKNSAFCRDIWEKTEILVQLRPEEKL